MAKVRVYYTGNYITMVESDPRYYEDGGYTADFHPYTFLVDPNNRLKGYQDVPEWFVVDNEVFDGKPFGCFEVRDAEDGSGKVLWFDEEKFANIIQPEQVAQALKWKRDQLATIDWTTVPLSTTERKIIIGSDLTDEEKLGITEAFVAAQTPQFVCDVCGKVCASASGLTLHKKTHEA